jgi:DNA-binding MarR family transcriptional regulator
MTGATEDLVWEVRRLFRELGKAADAVLAPLGITAAERALLEFLAKEKEPMTLSEIARKRSVSRQHIHQTLSRLNQEWIDRFADPSDARSISLSLSRKGRDFWSRIRVTDGELLQRIERILPAKEARAATATLRKIREALNSQQEERQ